ncbi:unnamed protein product [Peronospora farinosa]|uniref:Alpha-1,3-glucosyltransferase n=1 Tax=Peronospora farinosa TaxID=134698 RepID=A0AAV0SSM1_9STRA|nr:unnamed protein product [Peronospora farinosa]
MVKNLHVGKETPMKYSVGPRGPDCWHEPDLVLIVSVQRGRCHSYWVPDVWALCTFLDKGICDPRLSCLKGFGILGFPASKDGIALMSGGIVQEASFAVLPTVSPLVCTALTFAMMTPVLRSIWKYPDLSLFTSALAYCMLCLFLLGYHVHEKAILQVTLSMALMAADSVASMRLYRKLDAVKSYVDAQRPK